MKHIYSIIVFFVILVSVLTGCKKETDISDYDYGYNYLPDDSGRFVIYKVDSVIYNDFDNSRRYSTIYLKEKIGEQFTDNLGRTAKNTALLFGYTNITMGIIQCRLSGENGFGGRTCGR